MQATTGIHHVEIKFCSLSRRHTINVFTILQGNGLADDYFLVRNTILGGLAEDRHQNHNESHAESAANVKERKRIHLYSDPHEKLDI